MTNPLIRTLRLLCVALALALAPVDAQESRGSRLLDLARQDSRLTLEQTKHRPSGAWILTGSYRVYEDRERAKGRELDLNLVVLPAIGDAPVSDPVFVFHGGPGAAATTLASGMVTHWLREERDVVLIDQRGTGKSNPLHVDLQRGTQAVQGLQVFLTPTFRVDAFEAALPGLERKADLTKYTTPIAMDDANEVREALGYERINVMGGSYGSRAALVYMRRHPQTVRCGVLAGIAPVSFLNPLYHAAAAQEGWDKIVAECAADPEYREAFGDLDKKLRAILERLEEKPVTTEVVDSATGRQEEVVFTRDAFAEALRVQMYTTANNRRVPLLVQRAYERDYSAFAEAGIATNRGLRQILALGMLMCVVGSEDIPRIDPGTIERLTAGTFLGDARVRRQMAVARIWPRAQVPKSYGEPVDVDVPVLLISGSHDPVTPPRWGEEAASHLPSATHVVVPAAHDNGGPEVDQLRRAFLANPSVELDTSVLERARMARFELPD